MVRYNRPNANLSDDDFKRVVAAKWSKGESKQFAIIEGTFTNDSPDTNSVAWASCVVEYAGETYDITDDDTSDKYLYWELATPTVFAHAATIPAITEDLIMVGINTGGAFKSSWKAGQAAVVANTVDADAINGMTITGATIQTEATASRGIKLTSSAFTGYDSSGNTTFSISSGTGKVTAASFSGTDTYSIFDIDAGGAFIFRDGRNTSFLKLRTGVTDELIVVAENSSPSSTSNLTLSADGAGNTVKIANNLGDDVIATFSSDGINLSSGDVYKINGTQVVGAQGAAVADATNSTDVITRLNDLLSRLRAHGLIAT